MTVALEETYLRSEQATADLRVLNAQFIDNFVTNDVQQHARLLHESFVAIQSDGSVLDRETYLKNWATGFCAETIPYWDTRAEVIRIIGNLGLVRSTNVFVIRNGDAEVERATTYTDSYLFVDGRWICVQAQLTAVQPAHVPPAATIVGIYRLGVKETVVCA